MADSGDPRQPPQRPSGTGPGGGAGESETPQAARFLPWLLAAMVAAMLVWNLFGGTQASEISYTTFRDRLDAGQVASVTISDDTIRGALTESIEVEAPGGGTRQVREFVTYVPSVGDDELLQDLRSEGVEIETEPSQGPAWWSVLISTAPFLLLLFLGFLFFQRMRQQGQRMFQMRESKAKPFRVQEEERTTFDDVAGAEGPKQELREIIEFLKDPRRFQTLGGKMPKGILLVGPPGTGKTLMARAVAGEAEVPFYSITGSDFMEMFVGVGASRVRDLFEQAKKQAPAIVFIDELDSIGRRRGAGLGGGHDEREQTLNQLLSEMDGFEPNEGVILMAATNRPDILDPALLRPGRFDRRVAVNMPSREARREILEIHAENKPLADDVDLDELAKGTPGFSGADLENLLNEAALLAARDDEEEIDRDHVEAARDKVMMGLERKGIVLTDEERRTLAYHESGHALLAAALPHADPLHKVTIIPRGKAMGVTQQLPEDDKYIYRRDYLADRLSVMMGGRAAEELVFDSVSTGAENDFQQATRLARKMVLSWGMSERFGQMSLDGEGQEVFLGESIAQRRDHSEETAREVDEEVQSILDRAYERALDTLREHRDGLERLAEELVEAEELTAEQVEELLSLDGGQQ
ncbi:MAG: ATP-dependent zinc metalloprotease FtsH [Acidobacteriota bacterium]